MSRSMPWSRSPPAHLDQPVRVEQEDVAALQAARPRLAPDVGDDPERGAADRVDQLEAPGAGVQLDRGRVTGRRHPEVARGQVDRDVDRRREPLVPRLVEQVLVGGARGTRRAACAPSRPPNAPDSCSERTPASRPLPDTSTRTISSASAVGPGARHHEVAGEAVGVRRADLAVHAPPGGQRRDAAVRREPVPQVDEHEVAGRPLQTEPLPLARERDRSRPTETVITTRMPGIIDGAPHHHSHHVHAEDRRRRAPRCCAAAAGTPPRARASRKVDGGTHSGCCAMPTRQEPAR